MERRLSSFFTPETAGKAGYIETAGLVRGGPGGFSFDPAVTSLEFDSRQVRPGALYFALRGLHADGHAFIPAALAGGAAVIIHQEPLAEYRDGAVYIRVRDSRFAMSPVADAFYGYPSRHLAVIGVTGTEGKSTTVYLIYQLLTLLGRKTGFISTVSYSDGGEEQWNPQHQTTPEATAIHRLLADMRDQGTEFAILESSSHGLSSRTNRMGDAAFDAAVMTRVTHEHLEFHGSWEQYRHDKANLFRALDAVSHFKRFGPSRNGDEATHPVEVPCFGVVNADDESAAYFAAATQARTYSYSTQGREADLSLVSIESGIRGNRFRVRNGGSCGSGGMLDITDRLPGAFNAGNVLAALLAVSGILSVPVETLTPLVPRLKPVWGRMTAINRGQPFEVLVDYAHTPSSFDAVFPPLRKRLDSSGGRIIAVFGSAGERDTVKRPEQGRIAARWSDLVVLTDEDPRGEDSMTILEEIAAGCPGRRRGEDLFLIPNRPAAIRQAFSLARPGDLVLLLGKGHENSIIYADKTAAYDELAEAGQALAEMGYDAARGVCRASRF
ncbi:MAG: UDP-N-acetylmuramoyl-L-alanyl-D-glutamate--2,6-diaminopimelate ligase [Spirochaetaceae bacterium]|jgi:UDP-N-acetylmuramoyl-L-alanyl-D-glutamate--2,6-diaminopimelate ligase|nr:UDP-N-acetylmuramoyl-L-alanyl-D-glutamate--2,6-diaminopimelate ligase [Spirochaetaceae bacterium]